MDVEAFAAGLLRKKQYFRKDPLKRRLVFVGSSGMTASERYGVICLVYRRLEGSAFSERWENSAFILKRRDIATSVFMTRLPINRSTAFALGMTGRIDETSRLWYFMIRKLYLIIKRR